ncbi:unnamed protein product, partial [Mesorhabditis spiculigera]
MFECSMPLNSKDAVDMTNVRQMPDENSNGYSEMQLEKISNKKMSDLVSWVPDTPALKKRAVKEVSENRELKTAKLEFQAPAKTSSVQVKLDAQGNLVVDKTSLLVEKPNGPVINHWEFVEEHNDHNTNSLSFRKRPWIKSPYWNEKETELFYDILRSTGPDFTLMAEFFNTRTSEALKRKYRAELKAHPDRINEVEAAPVTLDRSLYMYSERALEAISKEKLEKALAKKKQTSEGCYLERAAAQLLQQLIAEADSETCDAPVATVEVQKIPSIEPPQKSEAVINLLKSIRPELPDADVPPPLKKLKGYGDN